MTQIRFKGLRTGTGVDVEISVDGQTETLSVPAFRAPPATTALPRITTGAGQFAGDMLGLDTSGLTGITGYDWRQVGGASLGSDAMFMTMGHMGKWVECAVTCDQGVLTTPAAMIYMDHGMMHGMPQHTVDDAAVLALAPHEDVTHIAAIDGSWSDPATWAENRVPRHGARVLIPHGRTVTYDNATPHIRLDWIRVDGTLAWALDRSTTLLVESIVGTRGSTITIGTGPTNRLPAQHSAEVTISGKYYRDFTYLDTDLNLAADAELWGRGLVSQGTVRIWGNKKSIGAHASDGVPAGATSLTLQKDPTGWEVGDEIIISGTSVDYPQTPEDMMQMEDEFRIITALDGRVVSWADPLLHDHDNQNPDSTRTDLRPYVQLKRGRNVTFRSEVSDTDWRRGHFTMMHGMSTTDIWDCQIIGFGRTVKDLAVPTGKKTPDGLFEFVAGISQIDTAEFDARSNIAGRYSLHLHHVGFGHTGSRPIANGVYIEDAHWGIVHHACDADIDNCSVHHFRGAAFVGEQGNELGSWNGNVASHAITTTPTKPFGLQGQSPKNHMSDGGLQGEIFQLGYGFAYRGRMLKMTNNVAFSCVAGHVFYPRSSAGNNVFPIMNQKRARLDLQGIGLMQSRGTLPRDTIAAEDYPIVHFDGNEAIACIYGMFVTKPLEIQNHDWNVHLTNFLSWGYREAGAEIEYVGSYLLERFDCVVGKYPQVPGMSQYGIRLGRNAMQIAVVNCRTEGVSGGAGTDGISMSGDSTRGFSDRFNNTSEPRYMVISYDSVNDARPLDYTTPQAKAFADVSLVEEDPDDTRIDRRRDPFETYPLYVGTFNCDTRQITAHVSNADGRKSTNVAPDCPIAPKAWEDTPWPTTERQKADHGEVWETIRQLGYWTYDGDNIAIQQEVVADQLSGRPHKVTKIWVLTGDLSGRTNNGPWTHVPTPVVAANGTLALSTAPGTPITFDVVTGATGGNGTYDIDPVDHAKPNHGTFEFNGNSITYTPTVGYTGTDVATVFVRSGDQYATVRIFLLVGSAAAPQAPMAFTTSDHGVGNTLGVTLGAPPDVGARRIRLTQYSTDGGTTWRRLCNGWVQDTHKLTAHSDGTPMSPGTHALRLRVRCDWDYATSPASAETSVTVT